MIITNKKCNNNFIKNKLIITNTKCNNNYSKKKLIIANKKCNNKYKISLPMIKLMTIAKNRNNLTIKFNKNHIHIK